MACNTISRALSLSNHGPPLRKISIELRATPGEDVIQAFLSDRLCGSIDFPISPISPLRKELRPGIKVSFDPYEYMYIYIYTLDSSGEQNGNGSVKGLLDNGAARRFRCTNTGWIPRRRRRRRGRLHMRIERIAVERRCKNAGWPHRWRRYRSDMNSWYPELRLDRKLRRSSVHVSFASAANRPTPRWQRHPAVHVNVTPPDPLPTFRGNTIDRRGGKNYAAVILCDRMLSTRVSRESLIAAAGTISKRIHLCDTII